jgi:hypothetical protein
MMETERYFYVTFTSDTNVNIIPVCTQELGAKTEI